MDRCATDTVIHHKFVVQICIVHDIFATGPQGVFSDRTLAKDLLRQQTYKSNY